MANNKAIVTIIAFLVLFCIVIGGAFYSIEKEMVHLENIQKERKQMTLKLIESNDGKYYQYKNILFCKDNFFVISDSNKGDDIPFSIWVQLDKTKIDKIEFKGFSYITESAFGAKSNVDSNYMRIYDVDNNVLIKKEISNTMDIDDIEVNIAKYGYKIVRKENG